MQREQIRMARLATKSGCARALKAGLLLAAPLRFWLFVGLFVAALIFSVGIWAVGLVIRGATRGGAKDDDRKTQPAPTSRK